MRLPELAELATAKDNTEVFTGYNHNLRNSVGEWYDQKNMTTDYYPVASPREKRSTQMNIRDVEEVINGDYVNFKGCEAVAYVNGQLIQLKNVFNENDIDIGNWFCNNKSLVALKDKFDIYGIDCIPSTRYRFYAPAINKYLLTLSAAGLDLNFASVGDVLGISVNGTKSEFIVDTVSSHGVTVSSNNNSPYAYDYIINRNNSHIKILNMTKFENEYASDYEIIQETLLNKVAFFEKGKHCIVRMGSFMCVFPDGVVYETANTEAAIPVFSIPNEINESGITLKTVIADNESLTGYQEIEIVDPNYGDGEYRLVDGQIQHYITGSNLWVNQPTKVLIYIENRVGTFNDFSVGDVLNMKFITDKVMGDPKTSADVFEGFFNGLLDWDAQGNKFKEQSLKILKKGTFTENNRDTDYIVVDGFVTYTFVSAGKHTSSFYEIRGEDRLSLKRKMPEVEAFACESQNRIWCCSKDGHEIYASALGNPYNFYDYSGIATDSYAVNVGTDGVFTGCINYLGKPLFFKENCLHYISGSYPSNDGSIDGMSYAVTTVTDFKGVEKGSEKSLAVIDNILYYKSAAGIVAYDGATTTVISDALGKEKYKNAVAGAYKNKYYISMQDRKGVYRLFVFDTVLGSWCKEDDLEIQHFLKVENELLYIAAESNKICCISDEDVLQLEEYETESAFDWYCETGNFGYSYPNNKYLSRLQVRLQIADGARASIYVQYNSDGIWHRKGEMNGKGIRTHLIPIVPIRCDHLKIKIAGTGDVKIYSIAKIFEEGGDV